MSYIGQGLPADAFQGFTTDSFTGDGSATTFTLSKKPFSEDTLIVVINNVIQKPTTNFTVSGTTLTIVGTAVASGDVIYAIHMGGPLPIGGAAELDLNGASDKLILDADADTTISADTDDQIDFKVGGTDEMTLSSTGLVINEGSNDRDFRVESNSNANMLFVDGGNNVVRVGSSSHTNSLITNNHELVVGDESSGASGIAILAPNDENSYVSFFDPDNSGSFRGSINYNHSSDFLRFYVSGSERARIPSTGYLLVGKTAVGTAEGCSLHPEGQGQFIRDQGVPLVVMRNGDDGDVVKIQQAGSLEGTISVSGSTVSYNAFTGGHWSRLADNSKPTILRGTIMDSIDEMCDWYQAVAEVAESTDDEGNVTPAHTVKEQIALGDKSVGDAITFTSDGTEYTGTIVKEDDIKHVKCKISDTADSKKVYGVFSNWDDADDGLDGDVNDMNIAQVGTFIIRVNKDVTVEAGDLLVSNGDGTAKKQDDDIIRSKTVAKVNSNIKVETYSDGSYTVPCTLHC